MGEEWGDFGEPKKRFRMKKLYFLLITLSIANSGIRAKTTGAGIPNIYPYIGSVNGNNNLPSSNASRIIGYASYLHNGSSFQHVDSTTYSYSFGRGGALSLEEMDDNFVNFDDSYTYLWDATSSSYQNHYHRFQEYLTGNKAAKYTCRKWDDAQWKDSSRFIYHYNNDLTLLDQTDFEIWQGQWLKHVIYYNSYNSHGDLLRMKANTYIMNFSYDANFNMLTRIDSNATISPSVAWHRKSKYDFAYDASNKMTSYTLQEGVGGFWVNRYKFDHTYSGNRIAYTDVYEWLGSVWVLRGRHLFSYNTSGMKTADEWQDWDAVSSVFQHSTRQLWTYNTYDQPLTYYSETYDPVNNNWASVNGDFFYRYYYQAFIPASLPDVSQHADLRLYPQPANDRLTIDAHFTVSQNYQLTVVDASGKLMLQQMRNDDGNIQLSAASFPAGNYFISIQNAEGRQSKQFLIAH